MSNYTIAVAWSGKDNLADSDANKVISGADFNTEFTAVQTAVNTKADINGSASEAFSATTASANTNTTQVATTAFVFAEAATKQDTLTSGSNGFGTRTVSTSDASGGSDGDIHYKVSS
jgi:hypothetical protein